MKKSGLFLLIALFAVCSMLSCLNDKGYEPNNSATTLTGDWTIVSDSTTVTPWGIW
jgi:hypothetical protein